MYIFLTNQYMPIPGATGLCIHKLAKELAKEEKVYTICYKNISKRKVFDNVEIISVNAPSYFNCMYKNRLDKIYKHARSLIAKLIHIKHYPLRSFRLVNTYIRETEKLIKNEKEKIVIVASYTPLEAVIAAYKLKDKYKDRVKIVYYSADTLSNEMGNSGILSASYRQKCGRIWEKKLFKKFDKILIMECHNEYYSSDEYKEFSKKIDVVNFPLFEPQQITIKKNNLKTSFLYAGTLYKKLRNPEFLCECMIKLSKIKSIEVDFFGSGDCTDVLNNATKNSNGAIQYNGMKSHEYIISRIEKVDILLSIGNIDSPMSPSKIYEYMNTGKPIIHFYTDDKDVCLKPLTEYRNSLLIKNKDPYAVEKIENFLSNYYVINYEILKKLFMKSTPEYTVNILKKMTEDDIN